MALREQEKLASVPCFMVTNRAGNPYLVPLDSGYDVGVVFLDPQDAEEMMQNMIQVRETPGFGEGRVEGAEAAGWAEG